jgi:hypothetical protein
MAKPVVNLEPALEDPCSDERTISFHNGVPGWCDYQGGIERLTNLPDGQLLLEFTGLSENVVIDAPEKNLKPKPPVETYWVGARGGAYLVSNGQVTSFVDYCWLHPGLVELLERDSAAIGRTRQWQEDVDGYADYLARLSAQSGIPEGEVLQQMLSRGRLGQHRSRALHELETRMFQPGMTPRIIGDNIKKMREAKGLSVEELAEGSGLDEFELLAFEGGLGVIFADELVWIAMALGLEDPEQLLEEDPTTP